MKFNTKITLLVLLYISLALITPCQSIQKKHKKHLKHSTSSLQHQTHESNKVLASETELQSTLDSLVEKNSTKGLNNSNSTNSTNKTNASNASNASNKSKSANSSNASKANNVSNVSIQQQTNAVVQVLAQLYNKVDVQKEQVKAVPAQAAAVAPVQAQVQLQAKASPAPSTAAAQQSVLSKLEESNKKVGNVAKSSTITIPDKLQLPTTPKGLELINHFGQDPKESPYGPQPTLIRQEAWVNSSNGTLEKTVITKVIQTSRDQNGCDISNFENFQLCLELTECDLCAAAPQCGWCSSTQRCLPGTLKSAGCSAACSKKGWNFNVSSCKRNVKSGFIRMAKEASKIIIPDITQPKAKVDTVITHQAVVRTPVLLGTKKYRTQTTQVDSQGNVISKSDIDVVKPIVGEIHQVMNVDTHHQQYVDIKTGKRLDKQEVESLHGKDGY